MSPPSAASPAALPSPPGRAIPITPTRNTFSPVHPGSITPTHSRKLPGITPMISPIGTRHTSNGSITTAADLLNRMGINSSGLNEPARKAESSVPQSSYLFGSDPNHSIWSTTLDAQPNLQTTIAIQPPPQPTVPYMSPTRHNVLIPPQELGNSIWSSPSFPNTEFNMPSLHSAGAIGAPTSPPTNRQFGLSGTTSGHQRVSSSPVTISPYLNQPQQHYRDTSNYSNSLSRGFNQRAIGPISALYDSQSTSPFSMNSPAMYGQGTGSYRRNPLTPGYTAPLSQLWTNG